VATTTWLEKTVGEVAGSIERAVFTEEHARKPGWLQLRDPRAKLVMFLALVLAAGLSSSLPVLVALYAAILVAARASRTPFDFFVKRVWLGIPLFAGVVILPSIYLGPPPYLMREPLGPVTLTVSIPAVWGALVFVARVGVSVSLAVLLVLTTPWADLLKSLQTLRVPQVFILVLSMTYRYIFLFLHTLNGMLESRRSRIVGRTAGTEQRKWIVASMGYLMNRSFQMSGDVYSAMLARGFGGRVRSYTAYRMAAADWCAVAGALALAAAAVAAPHVVRAL
jgi:cobalt/nickel transport system permease protein